MQTIQTVIPGGPGAGSTNAAAPQPGGDEAAFRASLRHALTPADGKTPSPRPGTTPPADGKTSPPVAGQTLPDVAPSAVANAVEIAPSDASSAVPTVDGLPLEVQERVSANPATVTEPSSRVPPSAAAATDVPQVAQALDDIAAGRSVASGADRSPAVHRGLPPTPTDENPTAPTAQADTRRDDDRGHAASAGNGADLTAPVVSDRVPAAAAEASMSPPQVPAQVPAHHAVQHAANPVAAQATQHAREVVSSKPAAPQANGLRAKAPTEAAAASIPTGTASVSTSHAAPARERLATDKAQAPSLQALAANATATPPAGADAAPTPTPAPTPAAMDFAALGSPALTAFGSNTTPPPTSAPVTAPAEFNITAPPGSPQFGPELGERLLWLVRDGLHEARLQLNPRELGPVEVRLSVGDGAAQLSFSAQHAGTAAAVQQSLPQLRDLLAQQGLQLGQATVSHQPAGDGDEAARRHHTPDFGDRPGWGNQRGGDGDDHLPRRTARLIGRGLVDAYA